ncbi:fatty acid synthase [Halenospora varia]|nr:fatty acid synthase [Halenospora varia]
MMISLSHRPFASRPSPPLRSDTFSNVDTFSSNVSMGELVSGICTPNSGTPSFQKLDVAHQTINFHLMVPNHIFSASLSIRDQFVSSVTEAPPATIAFVADFVTFLSQQIESRGSDPNDSDTSRILLALAFDTFEHDILHGNEVHTVVSELDVPTENKTAIISAYFQAQHILARSSGRASSALCRAANDGKAAIYAAFGGQGNDEKYFEDIRRVHTTYCVIINEFVASASHHLKQIASDHKFRNHYPHGLDVQKWLQDEESQPETDYLVSAPVSFPLIGLLQLMHFKVTCHVLGYTPKEMQDTLTGTTGHSQGIIVSAVIAAATSWKSFDKLALDALTILQSIGARSQEKFAVTWLPAATISDSVEHGEGSPSPMLSISNLPVTKVHDLVASTNKHLPKEERVEVALINGPTTVVVAGPPLSLYGLNLALRGMKPPQGANQSKIPFSQRKPNINSRFLPISAPFHSSYLSEVSALVVEDVREISLVGHDLRIPVYSTSNGEDLRRRGANTVIPELVSMITEDRLEWGRATAWSNATHILDFGPGGVSGIMPLTNRNKAGTGVRVILATLNEGTKPELGYKSEIFNRDHSGLLYSDVWETKYAPKLVKNAVGQVFVDTKFSRLLGVPPIMVAGMTPTTVSWEFVAATMNAGYHIELALGGYTNAEKLTAAIKNIVKRVTPGRGISCNIIYANPHAVRWQIPLLTELRQKGIPIDGLTIGAGVPSVEILQGYINTMGLKHISLKPGSIEAINQVIEIAKANPNFPIIVQWTGGRGGGHHSYEDFHQPILQTYSKLRGCSNIILVAGSGFGGYEDSYPYMTGSWSKKFNQAPMPFDGILLGSRVMVAKEAKTSKAAKEAIVKAAGVDDSQWEKTYKGEIGGIITVISELGEPIHKLATRGVKLWSEFDKTLFKLDRSKRAAWLQKQKSYVIRRLNDDFAKPWFGRNKAGEVVDLEEMTYQEVALRLISLMYVASEGRWVDKSWQKLLYDFLLQAESRSISDEKSSSFFQDVSDLKSPKAKVQEFFDRYPKIADQLIGYQDARFFAQICKRGGQKPVPFIPILDEDFETLFKKDSLWQSEDLAAIVDQDVGRICVLQGPVAVQWSNVVDEPISQILNNIHNGYINKALPLAYGSEMDNIPQIECFGNFCDINADSSIPEGVAVCKQENGTLYQVENDASVDLDQWLSVLGGGNGDWRHAFFKTPTIVQDDTTCQNPVRRLFVPSADTFVLMDDTEDPKNPTISLFEHPERSDKEPMKVVQIKVQRNNGIVMEIFDHRNALGQPTPLVLLFRYHPEASFAPIFEVMHDREDRVKDFYHRIWFAKENSSNAPSVKSKFTGGSLTVEGSSIAEFASCIGNQDDAFSKRFGKALSAPLDFAVVVAWKALMRPLFANGIEGDLLKLVHLSNEFRMVHGVDPIREGDNLTSEAYVNAIINQDSGKMVEVQGHILRDGQRVLDFSSQFLYRGTFKDFGNTFQHVKEDEMEVHLESQKDVAILLSKTWFQLHDPEFDLLGQKLVFRLRSAYQFEDKASFRAVKTTGEVGLKSKAARRDAAPIASIKYLAGKSSGNPVMEYLIRHGVATVPRRTFPNPVQLGEPGKMVMEMPSSNDLYGAISGDYNPIHVSRSLSRYVSLPGTITHGMYTSARVRSLVEHIVCPSRTQLFKAWKCSFTSMVLPGDKLEVKFSHIGMIAGRKILKVEASNVDTQSVVLVGEAEVEPEDTAYIFTGQGSQQKGMGMDLYASSEAARYVWDYADKHYSANYGFKITDIVRNDPKELTVHFGGPLGRHIREVYMSMKHETVDADGKQHFVRLFKNIDEDTKSHTYYNPAGLLSSTEFTQPALALMEIATYYDLQARGLISEDSPYAGHSLGEYSALCAVANIMPIEDLVKLVFYRGLTMQVAVERDSLGRSNFGMCAVDPSRLTKGFSQDTLEFVVQRINKETGWLLEIVNYNIENLQYACAGELRALECLTNVLNAVKAQNVVIESSNAPGSSDPFHQKLTPSEQQVLTIIHGEVRAIGTTKITTLKRGKATIPLKGIDVPFHSSFLKPSVGSFRNILRRYIDPNTLDTAKLTGRYIPNLTAKPFFVNKEAFKEVAALTGSPLLRKVADNVSTLISSF